MLMLMREREAPESSYGESACASRFRVRPFGPPRNDSRACGSRKKNLRRSLALRRLHRALLRNHLLHWSLLRSLLALAPQLLGRKPRAFSERLQLRPLDARMHPLMGRLLRKAAVGARDHVLAADKFRQPHDALADQFRMLDHVADMA